MSFVSLLIEGSGYLKYLSALKDRVKSLERLISDLNNSRYTSRGYRLVVGEQGAWIEVQFLDHNLIMVPERAEFGQNRVPPGGGFVRNRGGFSSYAKPLPQTQGGGYNAF